MNNTMKCIIGIIIVFPVTLGVHSGAGRVVAMLRCLDAPFALAFPAFLGPPAELDHFLRKGILRVRLRIGNAVIILFYI